MLRLMALLVLTGLAVPTQQLSSQVTGDGSASQPNIASHSHPDSQVVFGAPDGQRGVLPALTQPGDQGRYDSAARRLLDPPSEANNYNCKLGTVATVKVFLKLVSGNRTFTTADCDLLAAVCQSQYWSGTGGTIIPLSPFACASAVPSGATQIEAAGTVASSDLTLWFNLFNDRVKAMSLFSQMGVVFDLNQGRLSNNYACSTIPVVAAPPGGGGGSPPAGSPGPSLAPRPPRSDNLVGGLEGVWSGTCTQPLAQAAGAKAPACLPRGNVISNPYLVEFRDGSWNFTLVTNRIKLGGRSYVSLGYTSTASPISFVRLLDTGFCLNATTTAGSTAANGYITTTRTIARTMTGATFVTYEEVGLVSIKTGLPIKHMGCPSAPHGIVCDVQNDYFQYHCSAVRVST